MPGSIAGQLVLGRDYIIDETNKRSSDGGIVLFSSLPGLSKLSKDQKEKAAVLRIKLLQCSYIFQFSSKEAAPTKSKEKKDDDPDGPAKKAKLKAFEEILHLVNQKSFVPFEAPTVVQIMETLAANLFQPFPPVIEPPFYLTKSKPLWKEKLPDPLHEPLPGWMHREKAYSLFLRLLQRCCDSVQHGQMKRAFSECLNERFIRRLLELWVSPDQRERTMLHTILTHLYTNFTGLRNSIQNSVRDVMCRFISEHLWTEHRSATEIVGVLQLAAEIVNQQGFGFGQHHQKNARSEMFMSRVVLPMYQVDSECICRFSQPLFNLVNRCIFKQPILCQIATTSLLRMWPKQCTFKQGIFLNQLAGVFLCLDSFAKTTHEEKQKDATSPLKRQSTGRSLDLTPSLSPRAQEGNELKSPRENKKGFFNEDGKRSSSDLDALKRNSKEASGSFRHLPGVFTPVEEVINPFDYLVPVSNQLFARVLQCIGHSQACVSQAAIQMVAVPVVTNFFLRDEASRVALIPKLYATLTGVTNHPFQGLRQTIVHLTLLLERAGAGTMAPPSQDDKQSREEITRRRTEAWQSVELSLSRQPPSTPTASNTEDAAPSWHLAQLTDIEPDLEALLKKFILETEDDNPAEGECEVASSSDEDEETERKRTDSKPDLSSLKIIPPRSRAVVMVRNGSKQGNTVSDLLAATPTRRNVMGTPSFKGVWRNSMSPVVSSPRAESRPSTELPPPEPETDAKPTNPDLAPETPPVRKKSSKASSFFPPPPISTVTLPLSRASCSSGDENNSDPSPHSLSSTPRTIMTTMRESTPSPTIPEINTPISFLREHSPSPTYCDICLGPILDTHSVSHSGNGSGPARERLSSSSLDMGPTPDSGSISLNLPSSGHKTDPSPRRTDSLSSLSSLPETPTEVAIRGALRIDSPTPPIPETVEKVPGTPRTPPPPPPPPRVEPRDVDGGIAS